MWTRWATTLLAWTRTLTGASFVASTTSTRLWRAYKAANRPFPVLSSDDVMDFLIVEAVALKVNREDRETTEKAQADAEMKQRKKEAIEELKRQFPSTGR